MRPDEFDSFCAKHKNRMYCAAYARLHHRQSAEDATQEAMLRIFKVHQTLSFHSERAERVYAVRAAICAAVDIWKKGKDASEMLVLDELEGTPACGPSEDPTFSQAVAGDLREDIGTMVKRLSPKAQAILRYRQMGLCDAEIAASLDITPGDVRITVYRAKKKLRKGLSEEGYFEPT